MSEELPDFLRAQGYKNVRQLPDGSWIGTLPFLFTTSLTVDMDWSGYKSRYCYETYEEARIAATYWDGQGDPPGNWIVHKGAPGGDRYREQKTPDSPLPKSEGLSQGEEKK